MGRMQIECIDMYRFLLQATRYGYTRNNHLEPSTTYSDIIKKYLPKMLKRDESLALHTAKQLCEECISDEICGRFYDGEDDENGNRNASFLFVESLLAEIHTKEPDWKPYNYDQFLNNKKIDDEEMYELYEVHGFGDSAKVSDKKYSLNNMIFGLLSDVLGIDLKKSHGVYYNKERFKTPATRYYNYSFKINDRTFVFRNIKNKAGECTLDWVNWSKILKYNKPDIPDNKN